MTTLEKACAALLAASMLAVTTACSGSASPASSAVAGGSGAPAESSAASAATPTLDKIKAAGVLKVGVKVDAPSFGLKNTKTGGVEGFEIGSVKATAKNSLGDESKIETQAVTVKTCGPLLDNGEVDLAIATFTIIDERKKVYNFSDPYYSDAVRLVVKEDSGIKSLKDFDRKTIGVAQSSTSMEAIQDAADAAGVKVKFDEHAIYPEIKVALDSGCMQCFSVDGSILSGYVDDTTTILDDKYSPQEHGIASKLGNKDLAEYANSMVAQLEFSGELDQMTAKWKLS